MVSPSVITYTCISKCIRLKYCLKNFVKNRVNILNFITRDRTGFCVPPRYLLPNGKKILTTLDDFVRDDHPWKIRYKQSVFTFEKR